MLNPKQTKYKKLQKRRVKNKHSVTLFTLEKNNATIKLISLQSYRLTGAQIYSTRAAITKYIKRGNSRLRVLSFPDIPITKKPKEVRMGKGKGNVELWGSKIFKGSPLFEVFGGVLKKNKKSLISGSKKLPIRTLIQDVKAGKK